MRPRPPVINLAAGTFYRHHPGSASVHPNPPLFKNLNFALPAASEPPQHWCVVGPSLSGKTTFLQILQGQHLCSPPSARTYPYLATEAVPHRLRVPSRAIRYVGFNIDVPSSHGASGMYLSARYESKREKTDFSLRDYLLGNTELNALQKAPEDTPDPSRLDRVVRDLRLGQLLELPVTFLSNGQGRRARIARALLTAPEVLLLDEPFMGLDPPTVAALSPLLHGLATKADPRLVLSARPQDPISDWITHLVYLRGDCQVAMMGEKDVTLERLRHYVKGVWSGTLKEDDKMPVHNIAQMGKVLTSRGVEGETIMGNNPVALEEMPASTEGAKQTALAEPLVEMKGCRVQYGGRVALGNWTQEVDGKKTDGLFWTVRRGQRWGIFGPNGSGKTTIVSLICSDHPQAYSMPIKLFGKSRLPDPGSGSLPLTIWDVQTRIGHSSPEIHQYMPRNLTVRQVIENAWAETFRTKAKLDDQARQKVEAALRWFEAELNPAHHESAQSARQWESSPWADEYMFGELSFSAQRVALFLRAIIKHPDIVILDEAFSGIDDGVRNRCLLFLEHGETKKYTSREDGSEVVVDNNASEAKATGVCGLTEDQALICISHIREEIPDCIREWICLPEANSEEPARFGRSPGRLSRDEKGWKEIWGM